MTDIQDHGGDRENSAEIRDLSADTSVSTSIRIWLSRQSLPRWIGLLIGNTRELELRLADKDREIAYLRSQIDKWQSQCLSFQDTILLGKGLKATQASTDTKSSETKQIVSSAPGENLAIESEIDRLKEIFFYRPDDITESLNDLLATGKPRDREIARRFSQWVNDIPEVSEGVVISTS